MDGDEEERTQGPGSLDQKRDQMMRLGLEGSEFRDVVSGMVVNSGVSQLSRDSQVGFTIRTRAGTGPPPSELNPSENLCLSME